MLTPSIPGLAQWFFFNNHHYIYIKIITPYLKQIIIYFFSPFPFLFLWFCNLIYTCLDYTVISTGRILCTEDTCCDTTKAKYGIQLQIYNYDMTFNKQYRCVEDGSPLSKSSVFILSGFKAYTQSSLKFYLYIYKT